MQQLERSDQRVTRMEVAEALVGGFGDPPVSREGLVAAARGNGARQEVVDLLGRLPGRSFRELRQLWAALPDLPVSRGW